jgi:outer membrane protein OmpA-like peptidoglycan-associated protein
MKLRPPRLNPNRILAGCLVFCLSIGIAGCSTTPPDREWGKCALGGGIIGSMVGAGSGVGLVYLTETHPSTRNTAAAGAGGGFIGAVIGAIAGHEICDPIIPPPPPAPPVAATPPSPPPAPAPAPHEKLVLRGVHFDFNKAKIRPGDAAILDEAVEILKAHPGVTINVDGYCDAIGSEAYNLKLSQRRADAVAKYLEDHGIDASRLVTHGYGKTDFVASNDTDEGRAQNRRVELVPTE